MPQPKTKNGGKPTRSTYQKENAGRNRPAPGAPGKAKSKAKGLGQTVPLSTSNVQRSGKFLLFQPSEYLRCLGVTQDGYQCSRVIYRACASDDTWSCRDHPQSKAMACMPSKVWYHRCAINSGTTYQCKNSKSTAKKEEAALPWYCLPLHRLSQPQLADTRSDEEEAHIHRERVEREHAEDLENGLPERDSEVDEAERRNALKERMNELEHVYGDILQRDRAELDRIATERLDREHVEREHADAEWTHHQLSEPQLDDTSSDEEDRSYSDYDTPNTSYEYSAPSSPDIKTSQVLEGFQSQTSVYESAFEPTASRIGRGRVNEERPIKREHVEQEVLHWQRRAELEPPETEPLGWKRIELEQRGGDFEGARLGVNAQPPRGIQSVLATFWKAVSRATCNCAY